MIRLGNLLSLFALSVLLLSALAPSRVSGEAAGEADYEYDEEDSLLEKRVGSGGAYWYEDITRRGAVPYSFENNTYQIFRNVLDYGAKGDGVTDDTDAINNATADQNRCSYSNRCDSQSTTPAIIYFPPGTYMVSAPLVMLYYTQFVGNANNLPTIRALSNFSGIGLLDSDPYLPYGYSWWQNQNNFWRHVRNFILDISDLPVSGSFHCLHWQVAQGTSVQNVVFQMAPYTPDNKQMGIFMDNGSGGWVEDLVFYGGGVGFFAGNQQWTSRNLTFNNCGTAIYQNWAWVFNYKSIYVNNCTIGLDMTQGGDIIVAGSIVVQDSVMTDVGIGVLTTFSGNSTPVAAGTLVLDNVDFVNTPQAVAYPNGTTILTGNQRVASFIQGRAYSAFDSQEQVGNLTCYEPAATYARVQQVAGAPPKPASLLTSTGTIFERSKTQYEGVPVASFISIKEYGCTGDGVTDDTACVQTYLDSIGPTEIAFIDHGAYVIRDTIQIPFPMKMVGEIWPLFMVDGSSPVFADYLDPRPAFRVGHPGQRGSVEMQEIIFETLGPAPGAIMMEWNLNGDQGANCMWDVHWRIGGTNGTQLQSTQCVKTPDTATSASASCIGSFLLLHITSEASVLMANNWGWVADHELDLADHNQINIYNGRGMLVESQGPVWLYGTAFEHSMLYNYQIANAKEIYLGIIQSETAYMQANPNALTPFAPNDTWSDPTFDNCYAHNCYKTFGLRIFNSTYVLLYGAGMYSFFDNYDSGCLITSNCQANMVSVEQSEGIYLYAVSTKAATNMIEVDSVALVPGAANVNGFCDTVVVFEYP